MEMRREHFAGKFRELEEEYGRMQNRLSRCRKSSHETIRQEMRQTFSEIQKDEEALRERAENGKSPAISALSGAQLRYQKETRRILKDELPGYLHGEDSCAAEDKAEAAMLYAEYAIDFAAQGMRQAIFAALSAADLEMDYEEGRNG